ncbi:hypothetical protein MRY82_01740 [bacterium]|nr:hypothetical protein [bacterium]
MINITKIQKNFEKFSQFRNTPFGGTLLKSLKIIFTVAISIYLFFEISKIGWKSVLASLPITPYFYILFLITYIALPLSEQLIYSCFVNIPFWGGIRVFLVKKILNFDLISYSGEAYLFNYGVKHWGKNKLELFRIIKDNNIISSFSSFITALVLLVTLVHFEQIGFLSFFNISQTTWLSIIGFVGLILLSFIFFRKKIINFDSNTTVKVFFIHMFRLIIVYSLSVLQCVVVLPEIPYSIWFTFLAVKIIFTRIPFLPSQDIVLLGVYANVAKIYAVSQAEIMAIFIMIAALNKLVNFLFYSVFILKKLKLK